MVASGVPEKIDNHAQEVSKMALDLLAKVSHDDPYQINATLCETNLILVGNIRSAT